MPAYDLSYGSINIPPAGTVDIDNEGNYTLTILHQMIWPAMRLKV